MVIREVFLLPSTSPGSVPNLVPSLAKLWIGLARRSVVLLVQCFNIFQPGFTGRPEIPWETPLY